MIVAYYIYHSRAGSMCLHMKITFGPTNSIGPNWVICLKDQAHCLGLNETSCFIWIKAQKVKTQYYLEVMFKLS